MAGETVVTVVGNLTADPELRFTQNGVPVVNFTVASTPRFFDRQANEWKDGETLFLRVSAWRDLAEHVAGSITKGTRVVVVGRLGQRSYEDREGNRRVSVELEADEVAPSLRYATATVIRAASRQGGPQQAPQYQAQPQEEPWWAPGGAQSASAPQRDQQPQPPVQERQAPAQAQEDPSSGWHAPYGDDTPF